MRDVLSLQDELLNLTGSGLAYSSPCKTGFPSKDCVSSECSKLPRLKINSGAQSRPETLAPGMRIASSCQMLWGLFIISNCYVLFLTASGCYTSIFDYSIDVTGLNQTGGVWDITRRDEKYVRIVKKSSLARARPRRSFGEGCGQQVKSVLWHHVAITQRFLKELALAPGSRREKPPVRI